MTNTSELDRQRAVAVLDQEVRAIDTGNINLYLEILADDAIFLPPNSPEKAGMDLKEWLSDFLARFKAEWLHYAHVETVVAGDFAYHRFTYRWKVTAKAGGEPVIGQGKGLHILRRQPDSSWKITHEIWNAVPPNPGIRS